MPSTIVVTRSDASTDVTFTEISQSGLAQVFLNQAAGMVEPEQIEFKHVLRPPGAKGSDKHIITLSKGDADDDTGQFSLASVKLEVTVPRAAGVTPTVVKDLTKFLQCLLTNANVDALINGVSPSGDYSLDAFAPN